MHEASATQRKKFSKLVLWLALSAGILFVQIPSVSAQYPSKRVEAGVTRLRELAHDVRIQEAQCLTALSSGKMVSCGATYVCLGRTSAYDFAELTEVAQRLEARAVEVESHLPELRRIEQNIYKDRTAIIRLGFEKNVDDIDEWTNLVAADRRLRIKRTKLALLDTAFIVAGQANDISRDSGKLAELIQELKSPVVSKALLRSGVSATQLVDHFVKIHSLQNTRLRAQLIELALDKLGTVKDAWVLAPDNSTRDETLLNVLKGALGLFLKNSPLQLLLVEGDLTTQYVFSAALGNVAEARITQLTELTEQELKSLKTLTNLLTKNVQALKHELSLLPSPCL
jgi:hypothetical protein